MIYECNKTRAQNKHYKTRERREILPNNAITNIIRKCKNRIRRDENIITGLR
jgi:hypothetical protein